MVYRRKGKQERGSTRIVLTRISSEEYEEWKHRSEMLGITLSEYIRSAVRKSKTDVIIKQQIEIEPLIDIAAQYGKIGSNINQIAHYLNGGSNWSQALLDDMSRNLKEMYLNTKKLSQTVYTINNDYRNKGNHNSFILSQ